MSLLNPNLELQYTDGSYLAFQKVQKAIKPTWIDRLDHQDLDLSLTLSRVWIRISLCKENPKLVDILSVRSPSAPTCYWRSLHHADLYWPPHGSRKLLLPTKEYCMETCVGLVNRVDEHTIPIRAIS